MKRKYLPFGVTGFLFAFCTLTGREMAERGNILWTAGHTAFILACGMLFGLAVWASLSFVSGRIKMPAKACKRTKGIKTKALTDSLDRLSGRQFWLCSFALIALCWLPCYLAYYPGICAYDVTIQTEQIVEHAYNDHHPILHTLLIEGSMRLGQKIFGDVNTGIGIMMLAQMLALAGVFAWGVAFLRRRFVGYGRLLFLQLFCMLYPFHMYMSVTVIKDIPFSIFFFLQMLALWELIRRKSGKLDGYDLLFGVCSVGMQLFRNNGRYAMLVLQGFLILALIFGKKNRRLWGKLAVECLTALAVGSLFLSVLLRVTGAEQGDRREMLSMPIQQMARCMVYHGGAGVLSEDDGTMSEEDKALINDFLLNEAYREYRPDISDPVKRHTNTYVARYRSGDFIRTYLNLLTEYPGDFINAALAVNAGYLYVGDESHAVINKNGVDKGLGYVQTRWVEGELNPRGFYKDSKWDSLHELLEQWADENGYLSFPLLRYLFMPGCVLWLYLIFFGVLASQKRYDMCMPFALVMGYYLTLFLGPAVQLRYLYPLMITLPFAALGVDKKVVYEDAKR